MLSVLVARRETDYAESDIDEPHKDDKCETAVAFVAGEEESRV